MRYFELTGCPGIGKTTVTNSVINKLKEQGKKIGSLEDVFFQHRNGKDGTKIWVLLRMLCSFKYYHLFFSIVFLARKEKIHKENYKYIGSLAILCYELYTALKNNYYDIVVLDEGLVQYVSSLFHGQVIESTENIEPLFNCFYKLGFEPAVINCSLNINENVYRLKNRSKHTRFGDIKDDAFLIKLLGEKNNNLQKLSSLCRERYNVDFSIAPEKEITNIILSH